MLLADFHDPDEAARWRSTDDVVMGGQSSSTMHAGDEIGIFSGELSLEGHIDDLARGLLQLQGRDVALEGLRGSETTRAVEKQ